MPARCRHPFVPLFVAVLGVAHVVVAQPAPFTDHEGRPDGAVGSIVDDLVRALRSSRPDGYIAFVDARTTGPFRDQVSANQHRDFWHAVRADTGGVSYHGFRTYDPPRPDREHTSILRDNYGGWWGVRIELDDADPPRVTGIDVLPARRPTNVLPPPPMIAREAFAALDSYVDRLVREDAFSGAILVTKGGAPMYERAAGEASRRFHVPCTLDTKFNLGSMNKMFTAVAILQLVEDGELSLDDPLSAYVDDTWLPRTITDRVLIRHCLNHTSGLGSYFNDTFWSSSRAAFRDLDDYRPLVRGDTLSFEPGTEWRYSNTGFLLLGVVIERVTGHTYFDWVQKRVHVPAGMGDTACYAMDEPIEDLAIGYVPTYDGENRRIWRNNLYLHVLRGGPAGGGFSTVRDLAAFDRALRDGTLLSEAMRTELWTARPDAASPEYGYGFAIEQRPDGLGKVVGHGGGFPGLNGQLDISLDSDWTIAVLSNVDGGARRVAERAKQLLARSPAGPRESLRE